MQLFIITFISSLLFIYLLNLIFWYSKNSLKHHRQAKRVEALWQLYTKGQQELLNMMMSEEAQPYPILKTTKRLADGELAYLMIHSIAWHCSPPSPAQQLQFALHRKELTSDVQAGRGYLLFTNQALILYYFQIETRLLFTQMSKVALYTDTITIVMEDQMQVIINGYQQPHSIIQLYAMLDEKLTLDSEIIK